MKSGAESEEKEAGRVTVVEHTASKAVIGWNSGLNTNSRCAFGTEGYGLHAQGLPWMLHEKHCRETRAEARRPVGGQRSLALVEMRCWGCRGSSGDRDK